MASTVPNNLYGAGYAAPMAYSINYVVLLVILPYVMSLVLFLSSKITKNYREQLIRWAVISLYQFGLTTVLFIVDHFVVSLCIFVLYSTKFSANSLLYVSITEVFIIIGCLVTSNILFYKRP